jgi:thymidylate kinase
MYVIALEGIDGTGKSTVAKEVIREIPESFLVKYPFEVSTKKHIKSLKNRISQTRDIGKNYTGYIKDTTNNTIKAHKARIAFTFIGDQLLGDAFLKFTSEHMIIMGTDTPMAVCDRTWISTLAYQEPNLDPILYNSICDFLPKICVVPNLVVYLYGDPRMCITRVIQREGEGKVQEEAVEYLTKVKGSYERALPIAKEYGSTVQYIDSYDRNSLRYAVEYIVNHVKEYNSTI